MARQNANGTVSGQIGPVVYYVMNGKGYARGAAFKVKQTKATKQSSRLFGQSKKIGAVLRREITAGLPDLDNHKVMHRFDNALMQWLRLDDTKGYQEKLPHIDRFEFNEKSPLHSRFRQSFGVDFKDQGNIHLTMPEFDIPFESGAPSRTEELHWHIVAASCYIGKQSLYGSVYRKVEMPFVPGIVKPQTITLDLKIHKGTLTVVAVALRYFGIWKGKYAIVNEPAWLPTAVVGCCYNG